MRSLQYILVIIVSLLSVACGPKPYIPQPPQGTADHTLVMYLAGNNSLQSYLEDNVEDVIASVDASTPSDNGRIVVFFRPRPTSGDPMLLQIYYDKKIGTQCDTIRTYPSTISSSDPETLRTVMADVERVAPAKEYSLVFGSHATGWFTKECMSRGSLSRPLSIGIGESGDDGSFWQKSGDEITRTFGLDGKVDYNGKKIDDPGMEIAEMATILSGYNVRSLIFDACFMASVEAVYDLRQVADYVIASSAEIMGRGMPYDLVLKYLFASGNVRDNLMKYCSEYIRYYKELTPGTKSGTISLIDCAKIESLAVAVAKIEQGGLNEVDALDVQAFELLDEHQFYDLEHFYDLAAKDCAAYSALQNAISNCVVYTAHTPSVYSAFGLAGLFEVERSCGLTMNIPSMSYVVFRDQWLKTAWAKRIGR